MTYYETHKAERLAYAHAHRREASARLRERYATDPDFRARRLAATSKYYQSHKAKMLTGQARWKAANTETIRRGRAARAKFAWVDRLMMTAGMRDGERAQCRKDYARRRVLSGYDYRPRFHCRLSGLTTLDTRSQWLAVNLTPSRRAFARDLAIERKTTKGEIK